MEERPEYFNSRPSLGFPLGTALLLIMIFSLSGIFSCCYHWDKLQSIRRRFLSGDADIESQRLGSSVDKSMPIYKRTNQCKVENLTVLMPGDKIAKFVALPCPCEPPRRSEKISVEIQKSPK